MPELKNGKKIMRTSSLLTVCSCHVTYAFQSESTLYSYLNVKELLARSRREIWSLAKWLSVCLWTKWLWVWVQLPSVFFFHETMFQTTIMQSDITVASITAVFSKKAAIIIATHGQKTLHWQLSNVILSGMYNCNFEAIN